MKTLLCITLLGLVSLFTSASVLAQGQGRISGKVTDETGMPLPGVNVLVVGTSIGTASDVQGDYFIANLPAGVYSLRASFVGYREMVVTDIMVSPNRTVDIDFVLQEATIEGDEVIVVAERPLVELDNTTTLIRLEAQEVSSRPTSEFLSVLTSLPSVNFENGQMTVRGGSLDQVAFVVDGVRARNPLNHSPYTRINLSSIQELEVITGSFNAEYGEAQSGVINVITKEGGDRYELFVDTRFQPPGVRHWGVALYDQNSDLFWENSHARHLQWWIDYPDQWVDPNGILGVDPRSIWTAEQAYEHYMATHQPLTDYANTPTYQTEIGVGGPVPLIQNMYFYGTIKHRSEAPIMGNAYRDRGIFTDGTLKLSYRLGGGKRLMFSGFYGREEAGWGFYNDVFWATTYGIDSRYAYYDAAGYPYSNTNGQTLQFTHLLNHRTMYELKLTRVQAIRRQDVFPSDPIGWDASDATRDNLRAVYRNEEGVMVPVPGGHSNRVGHNTTGYYVRFDDDNAQYEIDGVISSQINKNVQLRSGMNFSTYSLDHFNLSKLPDRIDERVYRPYQGAAYAQSKIEVGGLIMNAGLRFDFYNPNDTVYADLFDPFGGEKKPTRIYSQLSPRLGISHPIDSRTKLHFSYGHFFQRPPYNDYGEGNDNVSGSLNTFVVVGSDFPWVLGNRNLRPTKTISYEVGLERNFWDAFVLDVTGYYKDRRHTIRTIFIESPWGPYRTTGNGNYADERGFEFSIRKVPRSYSWGSFWGYANASTRLSIWGRSGDPSTITPDGVFFDPSGDFIGHNNPIVKAGLFYQTPSTWRGIVGALARDLSVSFDYRANLPNEQLRQDYFVFGGEKHVRSTDQVIDFRARKEIDVMGRARLTPYVEVQNLLNQGWVNFSVFERASTNDQRRFVESNFRDLPTHDANGRPILDIAKYRNLPRQVTFGMTLDL
jgi:outer membrane receptor protein involved in Fe transport